MNSRIEKYHYENETEIDTPSRVVKNQELYNNIDLSDLSKIKPNDNVRIIENSPKTIDIEKIKKYIEKGAEEQPTRRNIVVKNDIESSSNNKLFEENRIYDINSVLEKAKQNRESYYEDEKYKKLRNTQYDILSKIEMYDSKEKEEKLEPEFNTDEKTLIDLINTVTRKKEDLLEELRGGENTVVTAPICEESEDDYINKAVEEQKIEFPKEESVKLEEPIKEDNTDVKNLDKSFYTNSMNFSKEDFEGFEELEKTVKKSNTMVKSIIAVLVVLAIITIFVILKYVLNIF